MASDLLFELGTEEIPSRMLARALVELPALAKARLDAARLSYGEVTALGTPRRLALVVRGQPGRGAEQSTAGGFAELGSGQTPGAAALERRRNSGAQDPSRHVHFGDGRSDPQPPAHATRRGSPARVVEEEPAVVGQVEQHPLAHARHTLARCGRAVRPRPAPWRLVAPRVVAEERAGGARQLDSLAGHLEPRVGPGRRRRRERPGDDDLAEGQRLPLRFRRGRAT